MVTRARVSQSTLGFCPSGPAPSGRDGGPMSRPFGTARQALGGGGTQAMLCPSETRAGREPAATSCPPWQGGSSPWLSTLRKLETQGPALPGADQPHQCFSVRGCPSLLSTGPPVHPPAQGAAGSLCPCPCTTQTPHFSPRTPPRSPLTKATQLLAGSCYFS